MGAKSHCGRLKFSPARTDWRLMDKQTQFLLESETRRTPNRGKFTVVVNKMAQSSNTTFLIEASILHDSVFSKDSLTCGDSTRSLLTPLYASDYEAHSRYLLYWIYCKMFLVINNKTFVRDSYRPYPLYNKIRDYAERYRCKLRLVKLLDWLGRIKFFKLSSYIKRILYTVEKLSFDLWLICAMFAALRLFDNLPGVWNPNKLKVNEI